jgi:hypothetical protein
LTYYYKIRDWVKPVSNRPLEFALQNVGKPADVRLQPFYKTYNQYYNVYWDYFTNADWAVRQADYEAEKKRQKEIEDKTIDVMRLGEMQPERDHNLKSSDNSYTDIALGRMGREARAGGFFSFEMKVDALQPNALLCTYIGDDKNRSWDILIDDVKLVSVDWKGGQTGKFYDETYAIPAAMVAGKTKITIRIVPNSNKTAGRIFGCRIIRG